MEILIFYLIWEQAFHKSHLLKLRVAPSETAMTDVLREVLLFPYLLSCLFVSRDYLVIAFHANIGSRHSVILVFHLVQI